METNTLPVIHDMLKMRLPSKVKIKEEILVPDESFKCLDCSAIFSLKEDLEKHSCSYFVEKKQQCNENSVSGGYINESENENHEINSKVGLGVQNLKRVFKQPSCTQSCTFNDENNAKSVDKISNHIRKQEDRLSCRGPNSCTDLKKVEKDLCASGVSMQSLLNETEKVDANCAGASCVNLTDKEDKPNLSSMKSDEDGKHRSRTPSPHNPNNASADWLIASYIAAHPEGPNSALTSQPGHIPSNNTFGDSSRCPNVASSAAKRLTSTHTSHTSTSADEIAILPSKQIKAADRSSVSDDKKLGDISTTDEKMSLSEKVEMKNPSFAKAENHNSAHAEAMCVGSSDDEEDETSSNSLSDEYDMDEASSDGSHSDETGKPATGISDIAGGDPQRNEEPNDVTTKPTIDASDTRLNENLPTVADADPAQSSTPVDPGQASTISDGRRHKCAECGKSFKRMTDLQQHSVVHTGVKAFKCDLCDAIFAYKHSLRNHYLKHTGVKAFKCEVCDKAFANLSKLKSHTLIHSDYKPYKCQQCDAVFRHKNTLTNHLVLHTGEKPYKCEVCNAAFARKRYFKEHVLLHTGIRPYKCDICGTSYAHKSILKGHMQLHTGEKPFKCDKCDMAFAQKCYLKKHSFTHVEDKPHVCKECGASFKTKPRLNQHVIIHNMGEKVHKCLYCQAEFARKSDLNTHTRVHTGEKPFKCSECGATFTQRGHLKTHVLVHTAEKAYKCQFCDAAFVTRSSLVTHSRRHTGEKPYKCGYCGVAFGRKAHLNRHILVHTGEKSYKCELCDAAFSEKSALIKHNRTHTGEKPYVCDVCGIGFTYSTGLSRHTRTHTGYKPYRCEICDISVAEKRTLRRHVLKNLGDNLHKVEDFSSVFPQGKRAGSTATPSVSAKKYTIERNFKCTFCDATFTQGSTLKTHIRTHTGEKPFVCSECGARFAQNGLLRTHIRIHTGDKPFKCPECGAGFNQKGNLKTHLLTHSGDKPHKCQFCGASYTQKGNLERHVLIHTVEKEWKCVQCGASFSKKGYLQRHVTLTHLGGDPGNDSAPSAEEEDSFAYDDMEAVGRFVTENFTQPKFVVENQEEPTDTLALESVEATYN